MISPSQRPLPDNTQHSQHTNIQALGGIRTQDRSRRAAKDLRLRPRGHWNRHSYVSDVMNMYVGKLLERKLIVNVLMKQITSCSALIVLTALRSVGNANSCRKYTYFYGPRQENTEEPSHSPSLISSSLSLSRGEFRPRQTRQLPRAVDLKGRLLSCQSY